MDIHRAFYSVNLKVREEEYFGIFHAEKVALDPYPKEIGRGFRMFVEQAKGTALILGKISMGWLTAE